MKVQCEKNSIKNNLILIERVTGKNLTLPVLNSIIFEIKNGKLTLKATNLEVGVEISVPAKINGNGKIALPGKEINSYLGALSQNDNKIEFELIGNNISFSTDKYSTLIKSFPTDDFPDIPKTTNTNTIKIKSTTFIDGIKSVIFSVSTSDIKPEIASVYVYKTGNDVVFVATDSFRLAEKKIRIKNTTHFEPILIPFRNAVEITKIFEFFEGEISVSINKNQLTITSDNIYFTSRLTDGVYPDYKQIMPTKFKTNVVVPKKDLIEASKMTDIFLDGFKRINVGVIKESGVLEIESKNSNLGENLSRLTAHIDGEDINMAFNHKYFSEVFSYIKSDNVSLKFNDPHKPMVIAGVGDNSFIYLVMPVTR